MTDTTRQRLLAYAVQKLGRAVVAKRLNVTEAKLLEWQAGKPEMPDAKLGPLADLIDGIGKKN